jgi:hypothetical protein
MLPLPDWLIRALATSVPGNWYLRARNRLTVRLERLDSRAIPAGQHEVRLFLRTRNEEALLPYFFDYYRRLGISRFFVVDDHSTDRTRDLVLEQPDAHLFGAAGSFARADLGTAWIRHLLVRYGVARWCVLADADEFLVYPQIERSTIPELCAHLDERGVAGLRCMLLDMYSDRAIRETIYTPGQVPWDVCPFFDPASHYPRSYFGPQRPFGGARQRAFNVEACLSKAPIVRFSPRQFVLPGYHDVWTIPFSNLRGVMLHFKFFSSFPEAARREVARGERWSNAREYRGYDDVLRHQPDLSLFCEGSVRYTGPDQLLRLNLLKETPEWRALAGDGGRGSRG